MPITKVLDEHSEEGVAAGPAVRMRSKPSDSDEIEHVVDEENDYKDNEVLEELSSNSWLETIISLFKFGYKIILSCLDYMAAFLNRRSREHRYVAYV